MVKNIKSRKAIYWIWALFDFLHIAIYGIASFRLGNTPYITDFLGAAENIFSHGGAVVAGMVILSWLLELSIFVSLVMFLLMSSKVKILCYIQTPFRLMFMVPSISIMFPILNSFAVLGTALVVILVLVSEGLKVFSLRKWPADGSRGHDK